MLIETIRSVTDSESFVIFLQILDLNCQEKEEIDPRTRTKVDLDCKGYHSHVSH